MINGLLSLIFPEICTGCEKTLVYGERSLCLDCILNLPRTNFHLETENPVKKIFWGRLKLEVASSFLYFTKGTRVQKIIHALKYKNDRDVGVRLGELFASELRNSCVFKEIDYLIPVPLHGSRLKKRGYNQSLEFSRGLSKISGIPVLNDLLIKKMKSDSQTRKSRFSRWKNVEMVFEIIDPGLIKGKHVLLVDDVVTTGSTLEACGQRIVEIEETKLSILTIATA